MEALPLPSNREVFYNILSDLPSQSVVAHNQLLVLPHLYSILLGQGTHKVADKKVLNVDYRSTS